MGKIRVMGKIRGTIALRIFPKAGKLPAAGNPGN